MKRPALCFMAILLLLSAFAGAYCSALSDYSIENLENCKNSAVASNSYGAYAYGSSGKNVYVTRLLPDAASYSVTVGGTVKSLCMDNNYLCAVYTLSGSLCIMRLDADSGDYKTYTLGELSVFASNIFAVSQSRVFFLTTGRVYTYVSAYSFGGEHIRDYTFSQNAISLFTNSGKSYVRTDDGSVYRLDASGSAYCLTVTGGKIYNAGDGWIADADGGLYSLLDGKTVDIMRSRADYICVDSENIYYISGKNAYSGTFSQFPIRFSNAEGDFKYITAHNGKSAVINSGFNGFSVIAQNEYESVSLTLPQTNEDGNTPQVISDISDTNAGYLLSQDSGIIYNIDTGTAVSEFKESFSQEVAVTNSSGNEVTSGKMKTGYFVRIGAKSYSVAVSGDLTGEGNMNSRDVNLLMDYTIKSFELQGAYEKAADYNIDGCIDNRDLILISRNAQ